MSVWTHVAVVIRVDDLRGIGISKDRKLGFPPNPKAYSVPSGSEGGLKFNIWINPEPSHIAAYTLMIWGDLRDYNNIDEIVTYLNEITEGRMIRQLAGEISVECDRVVAVSWDQDKNKVSLTEIGKDG